MLTRYNFLKDEIFVSQYIVMWSQTNIYDKGNRCFMDKRCNKNARHNKTEI